MKRWGWLIAGVLLVLIGIVWVLQGAGVVGGSFMTGQKLWFLIGLIALIVGAGFMFFGLKQHRKTAK